MENKIIHTCPLGSECEEIKDNIQYRCRWFQKITGKNPQSEELYDEFKCVFEWMNILSIEGIQKINGVGAAVESLRNEVTSNNQSFMASLLAIANKKRISE